MNGRVPASRHHDEITFPAHGRRRSVVQTGDGHTADPFPSLDPGNDASGHHVDAARMRLLDEPSPGCDPAVDDGGHMNAAFGGIDGRLVGAVVVGKNDGPCTTAYPPAVREGAHRGSEHDTGPVVPWKHQGPFDSPGGENDMAGPDLPEPLARQGTLAGRQMIRDPFDSDKKVVDRSSRPRWSGRAG